jgi:hypothetical protein
MAALADLADFEARYERDLSDDEEGRIAVLLEDASAIVRDAADDDFDVVPDTVVVVVCEMVRRAFDNPAGVQSETVGNWSWRLGSAQPGLYLTPQERSMVRRAAGKLSVSAASLTNDLPLGPQDLRYYGYTNDEGVVIVNSPEPEDL